jgi:hypothetical protein
MDSPQEGVSGLSVPFVAAGIRGRGGKEDNVNEERVCSCEWSGWEDSENAREAGTFSFGLSKRRRH